MKMKLKIKISKSKIKILKSKIFRMNLIQQLLKNKYGEQKSKTIINFLKNKDSEYVYNKVGELVECKKEDVDKILKDDNYTYRDYEKKVDVEIDEYLNPPEIKEGAYVCRNCNSNKTYYYQLQTRSADEPMTTFITCANPRCRNKWRE